MQYMKAIPLARSKEVRDDGCIVEVVIWELPEPLPPSQHRYKYRLFYGRPGDERIRYDNERGRVTTVTSRDLRPSTSSSRLTSSWTTSNATLKTGVRHEGRHRSHQARLSCPDGP